MRFSERLEGWLLDAGPDECFLVQSFDQPHLYPISNNQILGLRIGHSPETKLPPSPPYYNSYSHASDTRYCQ
jgi:hypothetical protein